jgi:hypothetical protein
MSDVPVTAARAAVWRALHASVVLASTALAATAPPGGAPAADRVPAPSRAHACDPAGCALAAPTAAELDAIVADADRLLARYADDPTPLGRECHALGATMRARAAADVRMLAYMWRAADPQGNLGAVTGDAHSIEPAAGEGRVHIARGYDALNPDRGLPAILQTARHEFAHLNAHRSGAARRDGWGADAAEQVAVACAAP